LKNILITGGNGYIAQHLIYSLCRNKDCNLSTTSRNEINLPGVNFIKVPFLDKNTDWSNALLNQQVVIHAAGAHDIKYEHSVSLKKYKKLNVDSTINLAKQAIKAGVKRFIFISSIKVNGENTQNGQKFSPEDIPSPQCEYGVSKLEAEKGLKLLSNKIEVVIIRPPLVYGPKIRGNFNKLVNLVLKKIPVPLGAINNKRTLIALDNLIDFIRVCIFHPAAKNEIFLVGDPQDLSTTDLYILIAKANQIPFYLIPIPCSIIIILLYALKKKSLIQSICKSSQIDFSKNYKLLNWRPKISVAEGIRRCFNKNCIK
jgi:nucleoside-diphosphate-sugar epimerase